MNKPLVSICCITYNHAPFIRQCLDGFLMQQGVDFEILIHDDCSTDGTTEIVREYAAKYPDVIKPLYEEENQYSKGVWVDGFNYRRAQGKYIAYCEGDDYWTAPLKLQRQVEFMESHPNYSVCFHEYTYFNAETHSIDDTKPDSMRLLLANPDGEGIDIDENMYFKGCYTLPLTMMFRVANFSYDWHKHYCYYRDTHETYHLLKTGKCHLMHFVGAQHNLHKGGVASMISQKKSIEWGVLVAKELYAYHRDQPTFKYLASSLLWAINSRALARKERWNYNKNWFNLTHNWKHFVKNCVHIFYNK